MPQLTKDQLSKLDKPGLQALAVSTFGVEIDGSKDDLLDQIMDLYDAGPEASDAPAADASQTDMKGSADKKYRLTIFEQDGVGGRDPVKVQVNGYMWLIKRGVEVTVPERVVTVLRNAVTTVFEKDDDGKDTSRDVRRFNFQVEPA